MTIFAKLRPAFRRTTTDDVAESSIGMAPVEDNKGNEVVTDTTVASRSSETPRSELPETDLPTEDAQEGVKAVEAVTLAWTKTTLIMVFCK